MQAASEPPKKPRYFYGWNIVAASFLTYLSYAEHFSSTLGFFMRPFKREFGWSRTQVSMVQTIARVLESIAAPLVGPLVDRYGPRVVMPVGAVIVGFTMLVVPQVNTIWQFWLLRGVVVAVGFTAMSQMVTNVAINNWFVRKRGRAIAFAGLGTYTGNVIMTPLIVWLIVVYGWRMPFMVFGILTFLVVLIPSSILMRRRPEDMGLHPDGIDPANASVANTQGEDQGSVARETTSVREPVWNRREVLMTSAFWMLTGSFALDSLAFQGMNISLAPYIQDLGHEDTMVAAVVTFRGLVMGAFLPIWGFVAEKADRVRIRVIPFLFMSLAAFLFLLAGNGFMLWLAVGVYGFGFSGVRVIQEVLWANFFGRLSLGLVRSLAVLIAFGFGALGPVFMNAIFDILGSYRPAFILFIFLFLAGAVLVGAAKPPTPHRYGTPD